MTETSHTKTTHFGKVKLGRHEAQHKESNLLLAKYVPKRTLSQAPSAVHYGNAVTKTRTAFPMYGNDRYGDCTWAAVGHHVQVWTANAGQVVTPADKAIEDGYWATGDHQDTGRYINEVLDYWRTQGIEGTNDHLYAYAAVDVKDRQQVTAALWLFGGLYLGVGLPVTAQRQKVWSYVASASSDQRAPYSWGGHAINATGYATTTGVYLVTWGQLIHMTWGFWNHYVDEAFALINRDWLTSSGASPKAAGALDLAALDADLASIG